VESRHRSGLCPALDAGFFISGRSSFLRRSKSQKQSWKARSRLGFRVCTYKPRPKRSDPISPARQVLRQSGHSDRLGIKKFFDNRKAGKPTPITLPRLRSSGASWCGLFTSSAQSRAVLWNKANLFKAVNSDSWLATRERSWKRIAEHGCSRAAGSKAFFGFLSDSDNGSPDVPRAHARAGGVPKRGNTELQESGR